VSVGGKERHLTFRIAAISTMCVGFYELVYSESIGGFVRRDTDVLTHELILLFVSFAQKESLKDGLWLEKRLNAILAIFAANAGVFESAPGRLRIVRHVIDHDAAGPQLRGNTTCALEVSSP
jgi:hypothetical protein